MSKKMVKTISQNERLQIIGLMTLARQHQKIVDEADHAMRAITGDPDGLGTLLSDAIYDGDSVDDALFNMNIEVTNE